MRLVVLCLFFVLSLLSQDNFVVYVCKEGTMFPPDCRWMKLGPNLRVDTATTTVYSDQGLGVVFVEAATRIINRSELDSQRSFPIPDGFKLVGVHDGSLSYVDISSRPDAVPKLEECYHCYRVENGRVFFGRPFSQFPNFLVLTGIVVRFNTDQP